MHPGNYRFYFWQFMPNIHEAGYIKSLSELGFQCTVIYQSEILEERSNLGLNNPDYGFADVIYCPPNVQLPNLVQFSDILDVHFLVGVNAFDLTRRAFSTLNKTSATIILISESRKNVGIGGYIRYLDSWLNEEPIRARINAVLAMGDLGVDWFLRTGYKRDIVFPFTYCVNSASETEWTSKKNKKVHLAFAGSFIPRKNPVLITEALAKVDCSNLVMKWFGEGPLESLIKSKIEKSTQACEHIFYGPVKNSDFRKHLQSVDILILPSRWDGWGAVVTEALLAGCRVLVSDHCGASALAQYPVGSKFRSKSAPDLAKKIADLVALGPLSADERVAFTKMAKCVSGENVAKLILNIIGYIGGNNARPNPLWILSKSGELNKTELSINMEDE